MISNMKKILSKIIFEIEYMLANIDGYIYGVGVPFQRCCGCGIWHFGTINQITKNEICCERCINKELKKRGREFA